MSRRLTVLFSMFEAALTVAVGIALPLVPLTIMWAGYFGFGVDWLVFWRGALDVWLLGHGVDVTFRLDEVTASVLGIAGAEVAVPVTISLLGGALLTVLLAARAGHRIAEAGHRMLGALGAILAVALLSFGLTAVSLHPDARPSLVQAAILPALVYALGLVIGMLRERARRRPAPEVRWVGRIDPSLRAAALGAARAGLGAAALTLAASAVVFAAALLLRYAEVIRLYESLHGEVLGGAVVTAAEFAILPNLVIWTASWLLGPGFAVGMGSAVSPLGTVLGPVPALPILGSIPPEIGAFGYLGLLVPVVAAFLVGAAARRRMLRDAAEDRAAPVRGVLSLTTTVLAAGVLGALVMAGLAAASAGAAGPGRLAEVGPDALTVGLVALIEFTVAIGLGFLVADRRRRG